MDVKVLMLKQFMQEKERSRDEIADYLNVSTRQLSRMMKRWQEQGYIDYSAGNGRGHNSKIEFKIDVEEQFIDDFLSTIEEWSLEEIDDIFELPLSSSGLQRVQEIIDDSLANVRSEWRFAHPKFRYMDIAEVIPDSWHPLTDPSSVVISITTSRLYEYDQKGDIKRNLVIFEEWNGNSLIIHLKRNILFCDGTLLHARLVEVCLNDLIHHPSHQHDFVSVISIKATGLYTLEIAMTEKIATIKQLLASSAASIYMKKNGVMIGTGPYYITRRKDDYLHLEINRYYFNHLPDITELYLTRDEAAYHDFLSSNGHIEMRRWAVTHMTFFIFNAATDRLTLQQRQYISLLIMTFFTDNIWDGQAGVLTDDIKRLQSVTDDIVFNEPVRIAVQQSDVQLVDYLTRHLPITVVHLTDEDLSYQNLSQRDVDMISMTEQINPYSLFQYLFDNNYWPHAESVDFSYLVSQSLILPINKFETYYHFPQSFRNVSVNRNGFIDYSQIIVTTNEEGCHD